MKKIVSLVFSGFISLSSCVCQTAYSTNDFAYPLEIPLLLSGNFGELRTNHFHTGIDIKTQGIEGLKVLSVADGYVSRIKVSPWGYGNVIYIDHPNGFTSVYAHLQKYNERIQAYIKKAQYMNETWEIELFPPDTLFRVKKGEVIALSGNTGSSAAPHLHFEIRDTKTEEPINPLLWGFGIKDNIPPTFQRIALYPLDEYSYVNGKNSRQIFEVQYINGTYSLKTAAPIQVYGKIGLAISTFDKADGANNLNGTYAVSVTANNKPVYGFTFNKLDFASNRAINAHIDYPHYLQKSQHLQKCFSEKCNPLPIYSPTENKGVLDVFEDKTIKIICQASDLHKNSSKLQFEITGNTQFKGKTETRIAAKPVRYISCQEAYTFMQDDIVIHFPAHSLYSDLALEYVYQEKKWGATGPAYTIHNDLVPIYSPITVSIKNTTLSTAQREKAVLVRSDSKDKWQVVPAEWHGKYLSGSSKFFGTFYIRIDTVAPIIQAVNIAPEKNMSHTSFIRLKISDNLSGIKSYKGYIDGKWVLMEYHPGSSSITHYFETGLAKGRHYFFAEVEDMVGNCAVYEAWFIR